MDKKMELIPFDNLLTEFYGEIGTPERDEFERSVDEAVQAYRLGEAVKQARLERRMTQTDLGERIGVGRSRISRIERGDSVTIPTMSRVFRALGFETATLDLGGGKRIALW